MFQKVRIGMMISTNVRANAKQQKTKELVAVINLY